MTVKDYNNLYFNDLTNSQLTNIIDEYVRGFKADRNKSMLKSKLITGMTYEEVAEEYDMSVRQVKYIISNTLQQIVTHLRVED